MNYWYSGVICNRLNCISFHLAVLAWAIATGSSQFTRRSHAVGLLLSIFFPIITFFCAYLSPLVCVPASFTPWSALCIRVPSWNFNIYIKIYIIFIDNGPQCHSRWQRKYHIMRGISRLAKSTAGCLSSAKQWPKSRRFRRETEMTSVRFVAKILSVCFGARRWRVLLHVDMGHRKYW